MSENNKYGIDRNGQQYISFCIECYCVHTGYYVDGSDWLCKGTSIIFNNDFVKTKCTIYKWIQGIGYKGTIEIFKDETLSYEECVAWMKKHYPDVKLDMKCHDKYPPTKPGYWSGFDKKEVK